ncbi:MAG: BREX system P-loop protein BrxC [Methanosarcinales archaeon]|nr:BREX system P-loop protein BrxC [Methanosarcinales archaeon]
MSINVKIEDLFKKDIKRQIDGVIKVDKNDDDSVYTELEEYVVTKESLKHFDRFFDRYYHATHTPTDKIGVWVSGFFGSGKSHFIKILSYLLENTTVYDKTALDFFKSKIHDPEMFNTIEKSVNYGTKDVILFNIDSKAGDSKERIVNILMRAFNENMGFFGDVFWIAELEEHLQDKGLYNAFKEEVLKLSGNTWEEKRESYAFINDDIIEALTNCGFQSRDESVRLFESDGRNYHLDVEKFAKKVGKYCRSKGKDHQVIFLIDEIGQYIGEDSELMLNLQTVVEELGTKLMGKAWVIVTSQADIDTVTKDKVKGNDFSKIQARFDTRLSLSSANVDEVIKKRILLKKEEHSEMLASFYTDKKTILKNLISFSRGSAEMKNFKDEEGFASVYPFVPYQINLLQKVFDKIRQTGFTGKHLARGERSMLNAFKESAMEYGDSSVGVLIPFHSFYNTVESFLDPIIKRTIDHAKQNDLLEEHDSDILKILFMIKHVKEIQPTLDNLVVLSISNVDEDKLKLREKIVESLRRLEEQTLINKSGETFHFLTNEEQEINREIKNLDIENHLILDEIYNVIYNSNDVCPVKVGDLKFNRCVDDKVKSLANADLTIKFLTPFSDEMLRGSGQQSLHGENLSNIDSTDTLLFIFPEQSKFVDLIRRNLQINKYLLQNSSNRNIDEIQRILGDKRQEAEKLKDSWILAIHEGVRDARVFIDGKEVTGIEKKNPKERVKDGFEILVKNVYSKSSYVTYPYESDTDILRILRSDDLEKFGIGGSETNKLALEEVFNYVTIRDERNTTVVLKDLKEHFMRKPYGWKDMTIAGIIATLFAAEEVKLRYQRTYLGLNAEEIASYLTRREDADKIIIEIRKKTEAEIISAVKSVLRDVFDKTDIPDKENDLYNFSYGILTDELLEVQNIAGKYAEEKRYPGEEDINNYATFLKRGQGVTDPSMFLKTVAQERDELERVRRKVEPVMAFFDSAQVGIFRRLSKKVDTFRRNAQFLSSEAQSDVGEIEVILAHDEPYSRIKELPQLESEIEVSLQSALSGLKQEVQSKLESVKGDLERELANHEGVTDEFKQSVMDSFIDVEKNTAVADDCAFVKFQITRIDELNGRAYESIEQDKQKIRETGDGESEIKAVPVEILRGSSVFKTQKNLETEDDVDEYVEKLRAAMKAILKEDKKIRVL